MTLPVVALIIVAIVGFAGIMWWGRGILREHPIRAVAVLCVAIERTGDRLEEQEHRQEIPS